MRKRRGARRSQPEPIEGLLGGVFRSLKLDEVARSYQAMRAFARAAGPRIRERARGERMRGATLVIRVSSAAWSHELHALKEQLLAKIRATPGGEGVLDLRFTVGDVTELPDWETPPAPFAAEPSPRYLALPAELNEAVRRVRDPELREELTRLFARVDAPPPR